MSKNQTIFKKYSFCILGSIVKFAKISPIFTILMGLCILRGVFWSSSNVLLIYLRVLICLSKSVGATRLDWAGNAINHWNDLKKYQGYQRSMDPTSLHPEQITSLPVINYIGALYLEHGATGSFPNHQRFHTCNPCTGIHYPPVVSEMKWFIVTTQGATFIASIIISISTSEMKF